MKKSVFRKKMEERNLTTLPLLKKMLMEKVNLGFSKHSFLYYFSDPKIGTLSVLKIAYDKIIFVRGKALSPQHSKPM